MAIFVLIPANRGIRRYGPPITTNHDHTPLTRTRVLNTALRIVNERGVDALTMRALASELDVEAPSLYKHVANKDEILDGLCELVYRQIDLTDQSTDWDGRLRAYCRAFRKALMANRNVVPIIATRPLSTEGSMLMVEFALSEMTGFGLELRTARQLVDIASANIIGQVLAAIGASALQEQDSRASQVRKNLPVETLPLASSTVMAEIADVDATFELSLDLLMAGVRDVLADQLAGASARV